MRALRCASLAAAILAAPAAARAADAAPGYAIDAATGHAFAVAFDPARRVEIGAAGAIGRGPSGSIKPAPEIDFGVSYRSTRASGAGRDRVFWQVEHRAATGWIRPLAGPSPRVPAFDAGLYRATILRHDESPSLVLPTSPPVGLPFPFDVGFDAEAGRVAVSAISRAGAAPVIHLGAARAAILLDPWRSGVTGRLFTIGVGARYDVDVLAGEKIAAVHRVAPMTEGSLRLRVESADGLSEIDARGEIAPHWTSLRSWAVLARASARLSRTLLAVDDQPIAAFVEGAYRYDPAANAAPATSDLRVSVGLALHLNLPR